jgi:hypothetical protein
MRRKGKVMPLRKETYIEENRKRRLKKGSRDCRGNKLETRRKEKRRSKTEKKQEMERKRGRKDLQRIIRGNNYIGRAVGA